MPNNHAQFKGFLENIQISTDDLTRLRKSRDANRDRVFKHWKEVLERPIPSFEEQGSFAMGTIIRPPDGENEDYDLDDGMYLNCIGDNPAAWPATATVQGWVVDAVKGYTRESPKRMKRCVRIPYQDGYHIDLPSYGINASGKTLVFKKDQAPSDFEESNPLQLVEWFEAYKNGNSNVRDFVRYFKAWRDNRQGCLLKIKSVTMTILIATRASYSYRHDQGVVETARACEAFIRSGSSILKPVAPFDDLTGSWTAEDRSNIAEAFKTLAERGDLALAADDVREGALIWQRQFGKRFPVPEDEGADAKSAYLRTTNPPVSTSGRNA